MTPGLRSLFLAVRSPTGRSWNFGPVSTTQILGYGLGITIEHDSRSGSVGVVATDHLRGRRVRIKAQAAVDTFVPMAASLPDGHQSGCACARDEQAEHADCHESFATDYDCVLEERRWMRYEQVERLDLEEGGALEFGGLFSHWSREKGE